MMAGPEEFYIPVKLNLRNPLLNPSKLRIENGRINYFLYQQDGTKQPMSCLDTRDNRLLVSWMQIHDSALTGRSVEELAARRPSPAPVA
jgi:hypothetical protein